VSNGMEAHRELGFVDTREMFRKARAGGYAVPAFNFVCLEQMLAIVEASMETRSPFILQCSANVRAYIGPAMVRRMAQGCVETMKAAGRSLPAALHLDHGTSAEECASCIDDGFSSVMIDGSALSFEKNIELTAKVVEYAHRHDVSVEGELGVLSGTEEDHTSAQSKYTDPERAVEFITRTALDSLAVSIGTSHGIVKIKARKGEPVPPLRFDILEAIEQRVPGFPIVLHGASALLSEYVETLNRFGGALVEAQGIPEEMVVRAVKSAVCKVNIASDGWLAMTAAVRKTLAENPAAIDPRKYLAAARREMKDLYVRKITQVMGSAGKAAQA
jgi:fructose-bisphosphate aldolase, class II